MSSLPYTLTVNANDGVIGPDGGFRPFSVARLRTGTQVPLTATVVAPTPKDGPVLPLPPTPSFNYQRIGTNIDSWARSVDGMRYFVNISIEDTSVYPSPPMLQGVGTAKDVPSLRGFTSNNSVILKDGQSTEFSAAADRITAEETRITVTITVIK